MFISYLITATVAPFLETEQRTNFVAAVLALYLLLTGVSAARRKVFIAGIYEKMGLVLALSITAAGLSFMYIGSQSPTGTVDGAPSESFILFILAGGIASIGEINVLIRKTLTPTSRIVRHLWRVCFSFFIASGSLFFGQAAFFPDWFNANLLPIALGFYPFMVLLIGVLTYRNPYIYITHKLASNKQDKLVNYPHKNLQDV